MQSIDVGISLQGKMIILFLGIVFIGYIFYLLKNRKISDTLGLIWLVVSLGMVLVVLNNSVLLFTTHLLGAKYPASALTLLGLLFIMSLLLYFTLKITRITQELRSLVQRLAMKNKEFEEKIQVLKDQIEQLRK